MEIRRLEPRGGIRGDAQNTDGEPVTIDTPIMRTQSFAPECKELSRISRKQEPAGGFIELLTTPPLATAHQ
jgi:hypothetical protein